MEEGLGYETAVEGLANYLRQWADGLNGFEYKVARLAVSEAVERIHDWQFDQIEANSKLPWEEG